MLGTALVLASMDAGYLMNKRVLKELVDRASTAPWVKMHPHRYARRPCEPVDAACLHEACSRG
jgi:hypothetical protein